jgi:16S rRNA processing protein RimM
MMGRIAAPHGVKGWVKVQPLTAETRSLLDYRTWWIGDEGGWQEHALVSGRAQGRTLLARMEGCDDRNAAALLRGKAVAVPRAALPAEPAQEYYWADLIGLRVVNAVEQEFGRVTAVMQTGANDVLVVEDGRERLIPFIAPVIRGVDPVAGVIRVDWDSDY